MIDPRKIIPLLGNMTVDREIGHGPSGTVYLVTRRMDGKKLALKHIPIPASDAETNALIFAGAVKGEADAQRYYSSLVKDIKAELLLLNGIKNAANLLKFRGYQVDQKLAGVGYDVYLLADYSQPLPAYLSAHPLTRLQAINLAIDLCSALEQLRSAGLLHKDVRPGNIYLGENRHFLLGDLGLVKLSDLSYSSMPDQLLSEYTAPEVLAPDATLSETMDIYSVGLILYEVYNGGVLPVDENGGFTRTNEELPAPAYADMALAEIIQRACAFRPEDRYQTPAEMKQALVLYMQRGNISGDPLIPVAQPEPQTDEPSAEPTPADVAAVAAAVIVTDGTASSDEPAPESAGPDDSADTADAADASDTASGAPDVASSEPTRGLLSDLGDDDLLLPPESEMSVEDFLASIRSTPGLEVLSMDSSGNTMTMPGYETEETLPEDTEYVDSADTHAASADIEPPKTANDAPSDAPAEAPKQDAPVYANAPRPQKRRPVPPKDDVGVYDDGYEEEEEEDEDEPTGGAWKKVVICVIVLLVLAGGAFGLYTFKTDTVKSINTEVLSSTSVLVTADNKNGSSMEVVCSDSKGEVARLPYTDSGATFTELDPSTSYTFSLESTAGKLLLGSKTVKAKTSEMTNLTGFAASSVTATSVSLALSGTGPQPDKWSVTLTPDSGDPITAESADIPIVVDGLTPGTNYTATIARADGDTLGGTTSCTFTTTAYTTLTSFATTNVDTDSISVSWAFGGTVPDAWTVTCDGTDGSTTSQDVSGTECTLDGLTSGVTYTLTLSCASLQQTDLATISVSVPSITVSNIASVQNDDGRIAVSWDYAGETTPTQWSISYSYESSNTVTPTLVTSDTNSVYLDNLVPNATYTITVVGADDLGVGGETVTTCVTGDAADYTNYGCSDPTVTLYVLEDNADGLETPSSEFTTSEHLAFAIQVNYDETDEDKTAKTLYVIRDSDGNPVYTYTSDRSWPGTWTTARHTGDLPDMPQKPGSYTFEVYFDNCFLASADFTVS